jgi:hypothetical protein
MSFGFERPARDHKADPTRSANRQNCFSEERPLNTAILVRLARPLLNAERTAEPHNETSDTDPEPTFLGNLLSGET